MKMENNAWLHDTILKTQNKPSCPLPKSIGRKKKPESCNKDAVNPTIK